MDIDSMNIIVGNLPARVRSLVEEWAELHREELAEMWHTADFHKVEPLI